MRRGEKRGEEEKMKKRVDVMMRDARNTVMSDMYLSCMSAYVLHLRCACVAPALRLRCACVVRMHSDACVMHCVLALLFVMCEHECDC